MVSLDNNSHSFIVRLWRESREIEDAISEWRGMIEHVESGERIYLRDLNTIVYFIAKYLEHQEV